MKVYFQKESDVYALIPTIMYMKNNGIFVCWFNAGLCFDWSKEEE